MLFGQRRLGLCRCALLYGGQAVLAFILFVVAAFLIQGEEAREGHDGARGAQGEGLVGVLKSMVVRSSCAASI